MAIAPGYTDEEVRCYVYAYERQPWGTKRSWLAGQGLSRYKFRRWRNVVFDGDLDRNLVPREGSPMTSAHQRRQIAKHRNQSAANNEQRVAENEQLRARIRELEATNEALGKAIGLLHQLSEQEPDTPETNEPNGS